MGSKLGYGYRYWFSVVDVDEIRSWPPARVPFEGKKKAVVELRTDFIVVGVGGEKRAVLESNRFDAVCIPFPTGVMEMLFCLLFFRLNGYWMSKEEINLLCDEAFSFAKEKALAEHSPECIGIVVNLEVCTVQQEGELFDATMDRAMTMEKVYPFHLTYQDMLSCKPISFELWEFLRIKLPFVRVENNDQAASLMQICHVCASKAYVGDLITTLPCSCIFHSRCVVRHLESDNRCPKCQSPAYDRSIASL